MLAVAAFALFELITLGALFGMHQIVQSDLDDKSRLFELGVKCDAFSDALNDLGISVCYGASSTEKRQAAAMTCDKILSELRNEIRPEDFEILRFERLREALHRYELTVTTAKRIEVDNACYDLRLTIEAKHMLASSPLIYVETLSNIVFVSLLLHALLAIVLVHGLFCFYRRESCDGGAVGGVNPARLSWPHTHWGFSFSQFAGVFAPVILEMTFLMFLLHLQVAAFKESDDLYNARALVNQANGLSRSFYDAGMAMGGYSITKKDPFKERFYEIVGRVPDRTRRLTQYVCGNQQKLQSIQRLEQIVQNGLSVLEDARRAIDEPLYFWQFRARHMYKQIRQLADQLQDELKVLTVEDRRLLDADPATQHRMRTLFSHAFAFDLLLHLSAFACCLLVLVKRMTLPVVSKLVFGTTRI